MPGVERTPANPPRSLVLELTAEQQAEALSIYQTLQEKIDTDLMAIASLLASKQTGEVFGRTEFEVRDQVHQIGAAALECALEGCKKGGT